LPSSGLSCTDGSVMLRFSLLTEVMS